jgi:hypothetical protein
MLDEQFVHVHMNRILQKRWHLLQFAVYLLVLLANTSLAYVQEGDSARRRMWVIYYKTEIVNPTPGTWGAAMPIFERYYDANTVRSIGQKRFVESTSCFYRRWKPGEPMTGSLFCYLDDGIVNVVGIDCKNNSYLYTSIVDGSPEWKSIQPKSGFARLSKELC